MHGKVPTYMNLGAGVKPYNADCNNLAPSVGVNWTPTAGAGSSATLLGEQGDTSISGGWSRGRSSATACPTSPASSATTPA